MKAVLYCIYRRTVSKVRYNTDTCFLFLVFKSLNTTPLINWNQHFTNMKTNLISICGTRYHRFSIIDKGECLVIGIISTPLERKELENFVGHRVGWSTCTFYSSEISEIEAKDSGIKIMGLSTFEACLRQFVPEVVLEEKTLVVKKTNKGVVIEEQEKEECK